MPRIGTRKLYYMLAETLKEHKIKIGRDKLFDLLEEYGMWSGAAKGRRSVPLIQTTRSGSILT